jgi:hypothetical protein
MQKTRNTLSLARAALMVVAGLAGPSAWAAGVATTYSNGDLFIGFQKSGVANTLAVNIGSVSQYIPTSITGGTWNGNTFNVSFGIIPAGNPGAGGAVTNLNADLTNTFGASWAVNNSLDSTQDVSWAVVGTTSTTANNNPISGLSKKSVFLTVARTDPFAIAPAPNESSVDLDTASVAINSFAQGAIGNAYKGRTSTDNSNKAYVGAASDGNNWGTQIGSVGSTFSIGFLGEQPLSGANSGPTNSILDLYLFPNIDSTSVTSYTYLGSFSLNSSGELTYGVVPEPGSLLLLGSVALVGLTRRPRKAQGRAAK